MGWWSSQDGQSIIGDGPVDTLWEATEKFKKLRGRKASLEELLNATLRALRLLDPQPPVTSLVAQMNDRQLTVRSSSSETDAEFVKLIHQALEDVIVEYEETEMHRKPTVAEVLGSLTFLLGPDDQEAVATPKGGVFQILPDPPL